MALGHEKMNEYGELFVRTAQHVRKNFITNKPAVATEKNNVDAFIGNLVLRQLPSSVLTNEGIVSMTQTVFHDTEIRDFIFNLTNNFFTRLGGGDQAFEGIVDAICDGMLQNGNYCALPEDIAKRLMDCKDIKNHLLGNKWLVTILLLMIFVDAAP